MTETGVSPDNITSALNALKASYNYAIERGIVKLNPFDHLRSHVSKPKERHILSRIEARKALEVLKFHAAETPSRKAAYLGSELAIFAGMRQGEIRAFSMRRMSRVLDDQGQPTDFYKIEIDVSWEEEAKAICPTKGRYTLTTVIYKNLAEELIAFAKEYGRMESELFFESFLQKGRPIVKTVFQDRLYEALREIGISHDEIKDRGKATKRGSALADHAWKTSLNSTSRISAMLSERAGFVLSFAVSAGLSQLS